MQVYVLRRLLLVFPTLFIVTLIVFVTIRLIPGDIIDVMAARMHYFTDVTRADLEKALGLDVPIYVQYGRWLKNLFLHGTLGESLWTQAPVVSEIIIRVPVTLELGILGLLVSLLIGLPIGMYSATRQDTMGDHFARSVAITFISVPGFWVGTMVIVFPSIWWGYMPSITYIPFFENPIENLKMFIVPAIVLGMSMGGLTMRMTRTTMLEVLRQDYVRTAWAKGLKERTVVVRHAMKNALIPVVSLLGLLMSVMIGGSVVIEEIFSLPGMGRLTLESVSLRDYTLVSGVLIFFGAGMIMVNLIVDLTYAYLDPRIRYS